MTDERREEARQSPFYLANGEFRFEIDNRDTDPDTSLSKAAVEVVGQQFKGFILGQVLKRWDKTGKPPKWVVIDVKVGME